MKMVILMLGVFFISSMQPVIMVMSLIIITLMYSYMIYEVMMGYWFSYALVMVMLSGVLVLFTYIISMMPNESFESYDLLMLFFVMVMVMGGYESVYFMDFGYVSLNLWSTWVGMYNLFMVSFLFSIMLMVVWLSCMDQGAVRIG